MAATTGEAIVLDNDDWNRRKSVQNMVASAYLSAAVSGA